MIDRREITMNTDRLKLFVTALFAISIIAILMLSSKPLGRIAKADGEDAATVYKAKCAMCHSPKAEKLFDPTKTDVELVDTIMKGKKGEKPPFMPSFEAKGMTADQAKAMVAYMKDLRKPAN
jgi:mono/diheme cytochrome c family protein